MKFGKYKITNTLRYEDYELYSVLVEPGAHKRINVKTYKNKKVEISYKAMDATPDDKIILKNPTSIAIKGTIEALIENHF